MVDEKQIEKVIEEDIKKDLNQSETVDPSVDKYLTEMGYIWERMQRKFQEDNICLHCKEPIKGKKTFVLEANKSEKGVFVLACVCQKCFDKLSKEEDKKEKVKK